MKLLFDERIFFHVKVSGKIICLSSAVLASVNNNH